MYIYIYTCLHTARICIDTYSNAVFAAEAICTEAGMLALRERRMKVTQAVPTTVPVSLLIWDVRSDAYMLRTGTPDQIEETRLGDS